MAECTWACTHAQHTHGPPGWKAHHSAFTLFIMGKCNKHLNWKASKNSAESSSYNLKGKDYLLKQQRLRDSSISINKLTEFVHNIQEKWIRG